MKLINIGVKTMEEATSVIDYYHILQYYGIYRQISFEAIISKVLEKDLQNNIFFRGYRLYHDIKREV